MLCALAILRRFSKHGYPDPVLWRPVLVHRRTPCVFSALYEAIVTCNACIGPLGAVILCRRSLLAWVGESGSSSDLCSASEDLPVDREPYCKRGKERTDSGKSPRLSYWGGKRITVRLSAVGSMAGNAVRGAERGTASSATKVRHGETNPYLSRKIYFFSAADLEASPGTLQRNVSGDARRYS